MPHKGKRPFMKPPKQGRIDENVDTTSANHFRYDAKDPNRPNKKAKIIVRNLPFKGLSEESVRKIFEKFGEIQEINLLKREDGKFVGCGFVQFLNVQSAVKAIAKVNGTEINGRPVIVDWALQKDLFLRKVQRMQEVEKKDEDTNGIKQEKLSDSESELIDFSIDKTPTHIKFNEDSDEDVKDEKEDESEDDEEEQEEDEKDGIVEKNKKRPLSQDVDEGKTVFVRNIPFSTTKEELKNCFEAYGDVVYALICIDKMTEHSKGTGFVKYKDKESADRCIKEGSNITLHDNLLQVNIALSKQNLETQKQTSTKKVRDSRNLYLVREGVVNAGSSAAEGVSTADMSKRLQIEQWKSTILRNLNMFVSKVRLVVQNLPTNYDDTKLRALFTKHSNPKAVIREARVMRERKGLDASGLGKSKEVGFVTFSCHEDALAALRIINNNPTIFTPSRRPIVGFSVENKTILNMKQKRVERSRAKLGLTNDDLKAKSFDKMNKKQRRAIKRKQNIIKKRQESKLAKKVKPDESSKQKKTEKVAEVSAVKKGLKRPAPQDGGQVPKKKLKKTKPVKEDLKQDVGEPEYSGAQAEPGKKIKLRSRMKIRTQANIHSERLKAKKKEQKKKKQKQKPIKEAKQKRGKVNLNNDEKFTKLISQYKNKIQSSANSFKKWYDNS